MANIVMQVKRNVRSIELSHKIHPTYKPTAQINLNHICYLHSFSVPNNGDMVDCLFLHYEMEYIFAKLVNNFAINNTN